MLLQAAEKVIFVRLIKNGYCKKFYEKMIFKDME